MQSKNPAPITASFASSGEHDKRLMIRYSPSMRHLILLFCAIFCNISLANANPRVIGILGGEQNQNLHVPDRILEAFLNGDVPLYAKPKDKKGPALTAKGKEIYGDYYNLNRKGLLVYAHKPFSWYMVGYGDRAYWIDVLPNIHFYSYYDLIKSRPAYLKQWKWALYDAPDGKQIPVSPSILAAHHREKPPVEVADSQEMNGELWIRIKILDSSCYEYDRPAKVLLTGWVPAFQPDNERTIWFNSNQCK